ncbi:MAG TPA: hypothetical protein ENN09_06585 [Planctomycetes bacterium]|nr:hypothetical protein [Planctomycetota bacterium]
MRRRQTPKFIKRHDVVRLFERYGCKVFAGRGKGSHFCLIRQYGGGELSFPFPYHREYGQDYIKPARRRLKLTEEDGISDDEFYRGF